MNNSIKITLFGLILYIFLSYIKNKKKNNTKVDTPLVQNTNDGNVEPSIVGVALMPEKVATNAFTKAVDMISNALPKVTHQMLADRYTPPKKKGSYLSGTYSRHHY